MSLMLKDSQLNPQKQGISLRLLLVVPFIMQIVAAVSITGYVSLRNGQQSVQDLTGQLRETTTKQISYYLQGYLSAPHQINQINKMEQITANTRTTILLCLVALAIAILVGLITSRWIAKPIQRLSQAAAAIADGDLETRVHISYQLPLIKWLRSYKNPLKTWKLKLLIVR
ncbi:HAMP domain-containing protein [Pseudanabaena sp. UWO311]|uniref:HAMP domain-containing protein n=1 Tax=Pseudanabaena sp. UWO311 TaxID=2487337 RepID=UPI00115BA334|nr:HAMP domain-containing protein [Pseudanabaena sp. UWO311]TYQ28239.1 HAMP domain-containing protein [Pseudanabaena sp. UWO311]